MIDRKPSPCDWSDPLLRPYSGANTPAPYLHDRPSARVSSLLGPDGEPLLVPIPRRAIGFDLRARSDRDAE